ncbi:MAG: UDP-2,3-diacylglucosamine diphosphatase [Pseudomonadota bacterium]
MEVPIHTQKLKCRTVFISDVHLGYKDCKAEFLLDFLSKIDCEVLYLLGDIVDLWSLKKRLFWPPAHYEVIRLINQLANNGTRIVYIPGNHDETFRDYADQNWGNVDIRHEVVHETAAGKKLLLFHGDALDSHIRLSWLNQAIGDHAYDFLLFLNRWCNFIRRRFGFDYWSLSTYIKTHVKNAREAVEIFENAAIHEAKKRGLDGVICGHIHKAEILVKEGILYCNDGDWVESCTALTEDFNGRIALLNWTESRKSLKTLSASNDEVIAKTQRIAL